MATWTSYFPSGLSGKLYMDVIVNQSSQSVTNNHTVLSWSAYVAQSAPTASWCHYGDATAKITINGTTVFDGKWNGTGNWSTAANWGGTLPADSDDVVIASGTATLTADTPALGAVTVNAGATLVFDGWSTLMTAGDVTVSGTISHADAC